MWILIGQAALFAQTNSVPAALDPTEAITRLREGLIDSFNKADLDRLLSHLDTNVVVTWQNGEVSLGREGVRDYYNKMMRGERPIVREVKATPEVTGRHVSGDWAVSWGKMNDVFHLTDGSQLAFNSLFTATIARRGEQWQVTAFHASVNAFDNAVLHTAVKKVGRIIAIVASVAGVVLGLLLARIFRRKPDAPK
jgi:ketosteroid isomerase-like protein